MAKTIIQTIGPLYGEVVNGTVFGRPNGSVYVPSSNVVEIFGTKTGLKVGRISATYPTRVYVQGGSSTRIVAQSQDIASNLEFQLFTDSDCTVAFGLTRSLPAGQFNTTFGAFIGWSDTDPESETTYYLRVQLKNNGVAVATSEVLEVVGI